MSARVTGTGSIPKEIPQPPARLRFTQASITYRQDGELRTLTFPNRFNLCVAPDAKCDSEAGPGDTL